MTTSLLRATLLSLTFVIACGGTPPSETAADPANPAAAPKKKGDATSRADEIIKELKEREARQAEIQKATDDANKKGIPVVVEVTPNSPGVTPAPKFPSGSGSSSSSSSYSSSGAASEQDIQRWRQEISVVQSRLSQNQQQLEAARTRLSSASAQMNDQNAAVRKMGQEAYSRAQQDVQQLQSAVYSDQNSLESLKSAAIRAGVPLSAIR